MPAPEDKIPFSEWRPIGVCDNGPPAGRKAQIFSKADFAKITDPSITRDNWEQRPEVQRLLEKYTRKLIAISDVAQAMEAPEVERVELVGTVLNFGKTPGLNEESSQGKVQLFQLHFRDRGKPRRRFPWAGLLAVLFICIGLALLVALWQLWNPAPSRSREVVSRTPTCAELTDPRQRVQTLRRVREPVLQELKSLPEWSELKAVGEVCAAGSGRVRDEEARTVRCAGAARQNLSGRVPVALARCAEALCASRSELSPFCSGF